jgi:uncharacterized delta-60 repeat protein
MKKSTLQTAALCAALICSASAGLAQIPAVWTQRYNAPPDNTDESRCVVVDNSGNVIVTGYAFNGNGNLDAVTIKYNPAGVLQWVRNFDRGVNDNDQATRCAVDASGNVYVTGSSRGASSGVDLMVVKYDPAGTELWSSFYNGSSNSTDEGKAISVDASGNVYVCGYETASGFTFDMVTVKFNSSGAQQWVNVYNGTVSGNDEATDLVLDASGNVYITGYTEVSNTPLNNDYITIKYNAAGQQQWLTTFNGTSNDNDYGRAIALDPSNNVLVTGYSFETNNWFDMLTVKYNNSGVQQWTARYNNAANRYEEAWDVISDINGNVYVTGQSQAVGNNSTPPDFATIKYNSAGAQQWVARYNGPGNDNDRAFSVAVDDSLNVYASGVSKSLVNEDFATVKYSPAGTQLWVVRYNGTGNLVDQSNNMVVKNGDVYVTGNSDNAANTDILTIRYSYQVIGFEELQSPEVSMSLYPNPASDVITIRYETLEPVSSQLRLQVFDATGRVVSDLIQPLAWDPNFGIFSVPVSALAKGVYMVRLTNEQGVVFGQSKLTVQ